MAFYNCSNVSSIIIPNSITHIDWYVFSRCTGLTTITIPNSVKTLDNSSFQGCTGLKTITLSENLTAISQNLFFNCSNLSSITIPKKVANINAQAFSGCSSLTSVVSEIETPFTFGTDAFKSIASNCTLTVPAGTKAAYIAAGWTEDVFKGGIIEKAPNSPNITFADANVKALCVANWDANGDGELSEAEAAAVTTLGTVFKNKTTISSFDELQYFTGLTSIGGSAFLDCSSLTSITIPNSVTSIGSEAFRRCSGLTSVTIPSSVTSIGEDAFRGCNGLTSVHISDVAAWCKILFSRVSSNPLSIAHHLFLNGEEVKDLVIPNSVTSIGESAFYDCSGLTSVTIPNSVTSIGGSAFSGCSGLTSVTIPNSVTSIGGSAFSGCI